MGIIQILGIGWYEDDLTLGAMKKLRGADQIILRTERCGCADWLKTEKIPFSTLDSLYEKCEDFDELTEQSAQAVLDAAEDQDIIYCVNDLSDKTCSILIQQAFDRISLIPGVSEGSRLMPFANSNLQIISASDADLFEPDVRAATLVRELDSPMLASDMKLKLTERYPDELEIYICREDGQIRRIPLCDLDRLDAYDHRLCALIPAVRDLKKLERYDTRHLEEIMSRLRDFDGCPWDREQTHETLRRYLIEEAYEVADAIDRDAMDDLYDELGDVLLQIVFHADIAKQYGEFEMSDVSTAICKKMIRRHPHVFEEAQADNPEAVTDLWNEIKKQEKAQKTASDTMKAVAGSMPALMRAAKVIKRAKQHGGTGPDAAVAWKTWLASPSSETLGSLLMALSGAAGDMGEEAELCLNDAVARFISQYEAQERTFSADK